MKALGTNVSKFIFPEQDDKEVVFAKPLWTLQRARLTIQ